MQAAAQLARAVHLCPWDLHQSVALAAAAVDGSPGNAPAARRLCSDPRLARLAPSKLPAQPAGSRHAEQDHRQRSSDVPAQPSAEDIRASLSIRAAGALSLGPVVGRDATAGECKVCFNSIANDSRLTYGAPHAPATLTVCRRAPWPGLSSPALEILQLYCTMIVCNTCCADGSGLVAHGTIKRVSAVLRGSAGPAAGRRRRQRGQLPQSAGDGTLSTCARRAAEGLGRPLTCLHYCILSFYAEFICPSRKYAAEPKTLCRQ